MKTGGDRSRTLGYAQHADARADGVLIEAVSDLSRLHAVEDLQKAVWGGDEGTIVPAHLLALTATTGGIVLGAFDGSDLAGFAFGLLARQGETLYHASHMLGIAPRYQGTGIGSALKWRQRERAIAQGLQVMTWTFDPLEARNSYFNLHKLGVVSRTYRENQYGEMDDQLNRGLPSDRLYVEWRLRDDATRGASPEVTKGDSLTILANADGRPVLDLSRLPSGRRVLIMAPSNIQRLKYDDLNLARAWRLAQREAFLWAFDRGYMASDYVDGAFVLVPDDGVGL